MTSSQVFVLFVVGILHASVHTQTIYQVNGLTNCAVVPANKEQIQSVAVAITNLDPNTVYRITPQGGAIMYWPGNSAQNYPHYAWALAITPENCAMGTPNLSAACGSSSDLTCCEYSTAKLGSPPPLLHASNSTSAFEQVSTTELFVSGQYTLWAWFQDDNCSNNEGSVSFTIAPLQ